MLLIGSESTALFDHNLKTKDSKEPDVQEMHNDYKI